MELFRLGRIAKIVRISAMIALSPLTPSQAQDASFPCKVLLCAAATNPSWTQIPYCVPIMQQAIYMQAWGIAVGVCAEAQSGGQTGLAGRLMRRLLSNKWNDLQGQRAAACQPNIAYPSPPRLQRTQGRLV